MKQDRARLLLLLLPAGLLLPFLGQFPYAAYSAFSDLAISHYPNAVYLLRALVQEHQIPLWSNTILSGYPFAADPLSGLWYPPGWLALLFPLPFGFNLLVVMHLLVGGLGMYLFLRSEGLQPVPSILGGLMFETLPRVFAQYAAGHLSLVYAISWTPWLLLAARRNAENPQKSPVRFWQGIIFGLILLADVRWAAYAGLLWAAYTLSLAMGRREKTWSSLAQAGMDLARQSALAVLVAAPLLLPLAEYTRLSTRQLMTAEDMQALSLPFSRLLGLVFPNFDGNVEWTAYSGAFGLLAFLWTASSLKQGKRLGLWIGVVAAAVIFALGSNIPGLSLLTQLPGFRLLRVPPRSLILAGFGLTVLAARFLQTLACEESLRQKQAYFSRLLVAGIMAFSILITAGAWVSSRTIPAPFLWGAGAVFAAGVLIFLRDQGRVSGKLWSLAAISLILVDLTGVNLFSTYFRPAGSVLAEGAEAAAYLKSQPGLFRIYTPSYSLPQQTSSTAGLELASGIDPLQLFGYAKFMSSASGIPQNGYSVTLPPYDSGNPTSDNVAYRPDRSLLDLLNVGYVAAEFDLGVQGLEEVARFGGTRIYQNKSALPRAWVQPEGTLLGEGWLPVQILAIRPNDIEITADGPGLLVLSEIDYPGWKVKVDGQDRQAEVAAGLLRSVALPPGRHQVQFIFQPVSVYLGLGLAAGTWAGLVFYYWKMRKKERND